jgi:hypothetical protein
MLAWPTDLAGLVLADAERPNLNAGLPRLVEAFGARPYGEPARIATEAAVLVKVLDPVIARLASESYNEASAKRWLDLLTQFKGTDYPDYDTARQRAWAFAILSEELEWRPGISGKDPGKAFQSRLESLEQKLGGMLSLKLPTGQNKKILEELPKSQRKQRDYDPRIFVDRFRALSPKR